jgi:hypothetical protein
MELKVRMLSVLSPASVLYINIITSYLVHFPVELFFSFANANGTFTHYSLFDSSIRFHGFLLALICPLK